MTAALANGNIRCVINDLSSNKTYYARAYYKMGNNSFYGTQVSFTSARHAEILGNSSLFNERIIDITSDNAGNVYAAGSFKHIEEGNNYHFIAKWNGSSWQKMEQTKSRAAYLTLASYNDNIYFSTLKFPAVPFEYWLSKLTGNNFNDVALYNSGNTQILKICTDAAGNVYVTGDNRNSNNKYYITKYPQAGPAEEVGSFDNRPDAICVDAGGNLYVTVEISNGTQDILKKTGSGFTSIKPINTSWERINTLTADTQGNIWATGALHDAISFRNKVIKWNGSTFTEILIPAVYSEPNTVNQLSPLCVDAQNNIYVSGTVTNAQNKYPVLKWNGSTWSEIAAFKEVVHTIHAGASGKIYMAGNFTDANGQRFVAVYDGN